MKENMIDLQKFCAGRDDPRKWMMQPFIYNDHLYATNGHVAIRINLLLCPEYKKFNASWVADDKAKQIDKFIQDAYIKSCVDRVGRKLPDNLPEENLKKCPYCDGTHKAEDGCGFDGFCDQCDENGFYLEWDSFEFYGQLFALRYLKLLHSIDAIISVGKEKDCQFFQCRDGQGVIMPMRDHAIYQSVGKYPDAA